MTKYSLSLFADLNPKNCLDLYEEGHHESGIYEINVMSRGMPILYKVYCDMSLPGGGWTVILKRRETPGEQNVQFNQPWAKYEEGFGQYDGEFFISLPALHKITHHTDMEVFVGLQNHDQVNPNTRFSPKTNCDVYKYARYSKFRVANAENSYKLHVSGYDPKSTAGDALSRHNGAPFSTYDNDNDDMEGNCAIQHKGGWWYTNCQETNLTGVRRNKNTDSDDGIQWRQWPGNHREEMQSVVMAIRPVRK